MKYDQFDVFFIVFFSDS